MQDGEHVEISEEEDFDADQFKKILKTKNQSLVKVQMLKDSKVHLLQLY
jgi:hypothetical protein